MPFTAKFSERFYAKPGHDVVDELVDWVNRVDLTYRSELRHQNEVNFQRFDARLDQRFAELDTKWEIRFGGRLGGLEGRFGLLDGRFGALHENRGRPGRSHEVDDRVLGHDYHDDDRNRSGRCEPIAMINGNTATD